MAKNYMLRFREADRASFEDIQSGRKSIETRAATVKYRDASKGDLLTFVCGNSSFTKEIVKVYAWPSVDAMLKDVPLKSVMPDCASPEAMKKTYYAWPGYEEKIRQSGLIGFEMA